MRVIGHCKLITLVIFMLRFKDPLPTLYYNVFYAQKNVNLPSDTPTTYPFTYIAPFPWSTVAQIMQTNMNLMHFVSN